MRVSFLLPGLHYGGVCRWATTLAQHLRRVEVASFISMSEGTNDDVVRMAKRIAPVYSIPVRREGERLRHDVADMRKAVKKACRYSDAIIVSAAGILPQVSEVLKKQAKVLVSHVTPQWEGQAARVTADVTFASHLVAVSKAAAECFPADREATLIANGVDMNRIVPIYGREAQRKAWGIPDCAKVAMWIGRFDAIKQPGKLLDALHHLPDDWYAVYVGGSGSLAETNAIAARASEELPGRVRFVPAIEQIGDALAAADCLVVTSKAESGPLVMLEAMAAGVPVVSSDYPASREFADDIGLVPQGSTSSKWAEAIQYHSEKFHTGFAQYHASKYSAPVIAHQWEEYLLGPVLDWHKERSKPEAIIYIEKSEKPRIEWRPAANDKPTVCFLSPSLQPSGGVEVWLKTLIEHSKDRINWKLLNVRSQSCPHVTPQILQEYGVPFSIDDNQILSDVDLVLAWGLTSARLWLNGYEGPLALVNHGANDWSRRWIQALEPYAQHFIGVSKQAADCFEQAQVIHNGIDFARLECHPDSRRLVRKKLGLSDHEIAVGFVGRISDEKNPVIIAEACEVLGPTWRPVYFGKDNSGGALTRRIDLANKYRIYASAGNIGEAYAALDRVVVASNEEGFSLVTVEALAAGCPLVSTPVGILPEIEEEHGQVAVPIPLKADKQQLATAIWSVDRDHVRVAKGKQAASTFTAEKMAAEWVEFIEQVVRVPA